MKEIQLKKLKDGAEFKRSLRSKVTFKVIMKDKGEVVYTSLNSERTFTGLQDMVVFIPE